MKFLVTANGSGKILRTVECASEHGASQKGHGESVWVLPPDAGLVNEEAIRIVNGELMRVAPGETWGEGQTLVLVE